LNETLQLLVYGDVNLLSENINTIKEAQKLYAIVVRKFKSKQTENMYSACSCVFPDVDG
jgi:hypothetical protein